MFEIFTEVYQMMIIFISTVSALNPSALRLEKCKIYLIQTLNRDVGVFPE